MLGALRAQAVFEDWLVGWRARQPQADSRLHPRPARRFPKQDDRRNRVRCGLSGYFAFQPAVQARQWRKPPRVSPDHDLKHRTSHGCRALEAFITVANSLTRSLLRDQCVLPDGCVTAHASARAAPRIWRHALPNDVSSE